MTIEEKAKDFAGCNIPYPQGALTTPVFAAAMMSDRYVGFKAGAEWMIEKAAEWFRSQKEEIGISWYEDFEIRFRKAMKE